MLTMFVPPWLRRLSESMKRAYHDVRIEHVVPTEPWIAKF